LTEPDHRARLQFGIAQLQQRRRIAGKNALQRGQQPQVALLRRQRLRKVSDDIDHRLIEGFLIEGAARCHKNLSRVQRTTSSSCLHDNVALNRLILQLVFSGTRLDISIVKSAARQVARSTEEVSPCCLHKPLPSSKPPCRFLSSTENRSPAISTASCFAITRR